MANQMTVACVQMNGGPEMSENLEAAEALIRKAADQGAHLISTPEITDLVVREADRKAAGTLSEAEHPGIPHFARLAKELGVTLHIGSMAVKVEDSDKVLNRAYVFNPAGEIAARYDKIHLYDADLPTGESHRESRIFAAGNQVVTVDVDGGAKLGLSICYDLRFPYLFRDMAKQGAQILLIPAAFTVPSGKAHWDVLMRARAIENGTFVMAAAQSGDHQGVRNTYGHSVIISPWGEILADADTEPGVIVQTIDLDEVIKARQAIPSINHDRDYRI